MHAQVVFDAQGPRLPQTLSDGFLRGVGDDCQGMSRVFCRLWVQMTAVPLAVGQGNVDILRLARLVGRLGQQLQRSLLRKSHGQVLVEERESLVPQGVLAPRDPTDFGLIEKSMHRTILRYGRPTSIAHNVVTHGARRAALSLGAAIVPP